MKGKIAGGLGLLIIVGIFIWYVNTPHDLEDCILKNLKTGMDRTAVTYVKYACEKKFLPSRDNISTCKDRALNADEISKIKGEGALTSYGYFIAKIYNGNRNFALDKIVVSVEDKKSGSQQEYKTFGDKIEPLTAGEISAALSPTPKEFGGWGIVSATICELRDSE